MLWGGELYWLNQIFFGFFCEKDSVSNDENELIIICYMMAYYKVV